MTPVTRLLEAKLAHERDGPSLDATALVHEADSKFDGRGHPGKRKRPRYFQVEPGVFSFGESFVPTPR